MLDQIVLILLTASSMKAREAIIFFMKFAPPYPKKFSFYIIFPTTQEKGSREH
jgi:hypothetical protein